MIFRQRSNEDKQRYMNDLFLLRLKREQAKAHEQYFKKELHMDLLRLINKYAQLRKLLEPKNALPAEADEAVDDQDALAAGSSLESARTWTLLEDAVDVSELELADALTLGSDTGTLVSANE